MSDFYQVLGSKHIDTPVCLVETWDAQPPLDPEDGRKCIISFALAMRDRLLSKSAAKDLLKGWSSLDAALIDSEVDRVYDSEERLSCEIMHRCTAISQNCQKEFCDYPSTSRDRRAWHGSDSIRIEDICEISQREDGNQSVKFSPDKAAAAIIKEYSIVSTPDERIWIYQDGIYRPNGDVFVDQILDQLAGDLYNSRAANETHRKILLRTLKEYSTFDSNPYLFCIENGVVDMQTGRFLKHDPSLYLTMKSPIKFDSAATCPHIEKFLGSALGSVENVLSFLDIMTAKTTDLLFEYFVAMIGGGSNGKTIAEELIRALFGDEMISEVDLLTLTQNRFDRRELFKKKFLINSEVSGDEKESRWIKFISGGGRIDADQKGKDHIQFRPRCLIIFDTNNPPKFADTSYAFQRRLVKIDFQNRFVDDPKEASERQRDPFILKKITCQKELSGLLNLLILRARDVLPEKRIYRRATGAMLADEYRMQSDSIAEFFEMFTEYDPGLWVQKTSLYSKYEDFCAKINAVPKSKTAFNIYCVKTLRLEEKRQSVPDAGYARVFWGIGINCRAFEDFCREDTNYLPSKSLSRPGLPSLPSLERIVNRIVHGDIERNRTAKKSGNLVKPGLDNENSGHNSGEPGPQPGIQYSKIDNREFIPEDKYLSIKEELDEINLGQKEHEEHFKTPISRNLSEDGEWEDCEYCGLPLPPSWQNERNGFIFCADCLKIYNHNGVEDNGN
jgi:putative DNA primase/helicase